MFELMLSIPGSTLDIQVIRDVVDVKISPLLGLGVLDENKALFDKVTNDIWNYMITY